MEVAVAALPPEVSLHANMTAETPSGPLNQQLSPVQGKDDSLAQEVSLYMTRLASPDSQGGRAFKAMPRAPGVTRQVSVGRFVVGLMWLASSQISSKKKARVPGVLEVLEDVLSGSWK